MDYLELKIHLNEDFSEILVAELGQLEFESFVEEGSLLYGYILQQNYNPTSVGIILEQYSDQIISHEVILVQRQNWNKKWEENYDPIIVDDRCAVIASFHRLPKNYDYEVIVDPKMSFGTGHHETTYQMISNLLNIENKGITVLDAGCGTGILAILASKLGAKSVRAIDIDDWAIENAIENTRVNSCENIDVRLGTVKDIKESFDLILANINKNVLIEESRQYVSLLKNGGKLLISGFYTSDCNELIQVFENLGLSELKQSIRNNWCCILFSKD